MSTERINFSSKSIWEPLRGYSRAVLVGNQLFISGTTAVDSKGEVVAAHEPYEQTRFVINRIREILTAAGFQISDVVRTRLFVTNLSRWEDYAKAHRDAFEKIRPASSIVQVARLVDPRLTIEMEVDAVKGLDLIESRSL
ncbi:MAG: RidA family protein [Proteobacteria bacterium]|nr:RidA family protein [Pseudomonadota bacterium]